MVITVGGDGSPHKRKVWGKPSPSYFSRKEESLVLWVYLEDLEPVPLRLFTPSFSLPAEKIRFGMVPTV